METQRRSPKPFALAVCAGTLVALGMVASPSSEASDIWVPRTCGAARNEPCAGMLNLSGPIEAGDDEKLRRVLAAAGLPRREEGRHAYSLSLDSVGGDVQAALAIGRIVRQSRAATIVSRPARCASACVLILGAGVFRVADGDVIIHRPFFGALAPGQSSAQVQQRYREMRRQIDEYAHEMNLPGGLIELMFSVPPERGRVLTFEELDTFMLAGTDPVFDEQETALLAQAWALTSREFRVRKAQIEQTCRLPIQGGQWGSQAQWQEYNACRLSILGNLSIPAARQAIAQGFPNWPAAPVPLERLAALNPSRPVPVDETIPFDATRRPSTPAALPPSAPAPDVITIEEVNRRLALQRISEHVARFWTAPFFAVPSIGIRIVEVRVRLDLDGTVRDAQIHDQARYRSDERFRAAADSAVRAVRLASPLPLPVDGREQFREITIPFDLNRL